MVLFQHANKRGDRKSMAKLQSLESPTPDNFFDSNKMVPVNIIPPSAILGKSADEDEIVMLAEVSNTVILAFNSKIREIWN